MSNHNAIRVSKLTLITTCLILGFVLTKCSLAYAAEVYSVKGISIVTGQTVRGVIDDSYLNGTVSGVVTEFGEAVLVTGEWSGKGIMEVFSSDGRWYELEVVE